MFKVICTLHNCECDPSEDSYIHGTTPTMMVSMHEDGRWSFDLSDWFCSNWNLDEECELDIQFTN